MNILAHINTVLVYQMSCPPESSFPGTGSYFASVLVQARSTQQGLHVELEREEFGPAPGLARSQAQGG